MTTRPLPTMNEVSPAQQPEWQARLARVARHQPGPMDDTLLARLLQAVDETILPRRLSVICAQSTMATLVICHRKLVAMDVAGHPVHPETTAEAAVIFAAALRRLAHMLGTRPFSLRSAPCRVPAGDMRCASGNLKQALMQDAKLQDIPASPTLDPIEQVRQSAFAWLETDQNCSNFVQGGDEKYSSCLQDSLRIARQIITSDRFLSDPIQWVAIPLSAELSLILRKTVHGKILAITSTETVRNLTISL